MSSPRSPAAGERRAMALRPALTVLMLALLLGIQPATTAPYRPALAAFGIGAGLGLRKNGIVLSLALGIWFWSVCIAVVAWTLVRRHG